MKKLILLVVASLAIISCDLGSTEDGVEYVIAPVKDVTMAATYKVDSISIITVRYKRPNDCHVFNGYYYAIQDYTRTCAVEFVRMANTSNCEEDETVYEIPLNFKPRYSGTYHFRFWDGMNNDGTYHYFEADAIVND